MFDGHMTRVRAEYELLQLGYTYSHYDNAWFPGLESAWPPSEGAVRLMWYLEAFHGSGGFFCRRALLPHLPECPRAPSRYEKWARAAGRWMDDNRVQLLALLGAVYVIGIIALQTHAPADRGLMQAFTGVIIVGLLLMLVFRVHLAAKGAVTDRYLRRKKNFEARNRELAPKYAPTNWEEW